MKNIFGLLFTGFAAGFLIGGYAVLNGYLQDQIEELKHSKDEEEESE